MLSLSNLNIYKFCLLWIFLKIVISDKTLNKLTRGFIFNVIECALIVVVVILSFSTNTLIRYIYNINVFNMYINIYVFCLRNDLAFNHRTSQFLGGDYTLSYQQFM